MSSRSGSMRGGAKCERATSAADGPQSCPCRPRARNLKDGADPGPAASGFAPRLCAPRLRPSFAPRPLPQHRRADAGRPCERRPPQRPRGSAEGRGGRAPQAAGPGPRPCPRHGSPPAARPGGGGGYAGRGRAAEHRRGAVRRAAARVAVSHRRRRAACRGGLRAGAAAGGRAADAGHGPAC